MELTDKLTPDVLSDASLAPVDIRERRPFLTVVGGLGDVARRFYLTNTYEILDTLDSPTAVLCSSHNPATTQFFRFHRNCRNLIIVDVGHIYVPMVRDPKIDKRDVNSALMALCGFRNEDQLARPRNPTPIRDFHAPDSIRDATGHVVVHAFGRGWGDWPNETVNLVIQALQSVHGDVPIFVLCADYIANDGSVKREIFPAGISNITVLHNLSAPAAFSLVGRASRFIGTMSSLTQVAAFEDIPTLVLHPERCIDFIPPYTDYSRTIWQHNGISVPYDHLSTTDLSRMLARFLESAPTPIVVAEALREWIVSPTF